MNRPTYIFRIISIILILLLVTFNACSSGTSQISSSDNVQFIPYLDPIRVDGNAGDWPVTYVPVRLLSDILGEAPDSSDLFAEFRLAWNENGLYFLAEIKDDHIYEDPDRFWNGDGIELFVSPMPGSFDIMQISLRPSLDLGDSLISMKFFDHRKSDSLKSRLPESVFYGSKSSTSYLIEGLIPLEMIGIVDVHENREMGIQLYINDSDQEDDTSNFSLPWFPVRDSYRNPWAFHKIRFSKSSVPSMPCEIRAFVRDDQTLHVKYLSDKPTGNRIMAFQAGNQFRRINLKAEKPGLFSYEVDFPLRKHFSAKDRLQFFQSDSLFFGIDLLALHRVYENTDEPNRFEKEIRIFEILDHFNPIPAGSTIITGSSTIRRWNTLERDLPELDPVNRGFGGSTMKDLNFYAERIIFPYNPSGIIIYEGDNDIGRGASPAQFIDDCIEFIQLCQQEIPATEIYFLSIKPSPSRMRNWQDMQVANDMLLELSSRYENVYFIDISRGLLNGSREPRKELFENDRLHLNDMGYEIISNTIRTKLAELKPQITNE